MGALTYILSTPEVLDKVHDLFAELNLSVQNILAAFISTKCCCSCYNKKKLDTSIRKKFDMNCDTKKYFCMVLYFVFFFFSSAWPETLLLQAQKLGLQLGATTPRSLW